MKFKKEYIVLLLVIAGLVGYLSFRDSGQSDRDLPQPKAVDSAKIDRLIVTGKNHTPLEIVKKDEKWFIEPQGYPADSAQAKNMVNAIGELRLTALISESGNYDRYGLSDNDKIDVQVYAAGAKLNEIEIGATAPTNQHTFVMLTGDPNVYHARGNIQRTFDLTAEKLRDKSIFDFEAAHITAITLHEADKTIALSRKELPKEEKASGKEDPGGPAAKPKTEWQDTEGRAVDQNAVEQLLNNMAHLDCDTYMEDGAKEKLTDPTWTATFKNDKDEFTIALFGKVKPEADQRPATASASAYAFLLNQTRVQNYEKNLNTLFGNAPSK